MRLDLFLYSFINNVWLWLTINSNIATSFTGLKTTQEELNSRDRGDKFNASLVSQSQKNIYFLSRYSKS